MNKKREKTKKKKEGQFSSVIFLDDAGSEIKLSAVVLKKLTAMQQNRRHDFTSYLCLLQNFKDATTRIRNDISHLMLFKPTNEVKKRKPSRFVSSLERLPWSSQTSKRGPELYKISSPGVSQAFLRSSTQPIWRQFPSRASTCFCLMT